jgi:glycosyltransferase involved in cell wall biosynthesis
LAEQTAQLDVAAKLGSTRPLRIVQFLKWMRRRDGGVVNTVSLLCPMLTDLGHRVTLLSSENEDLKDPCWFHQHPKAGDAIQHRAGTTACVTVPMRDRLAELRGTSMLASERDEPFQLLTGEGLAICEAALRDADVLHLHGPWASTNIQMASLARRMGVPYVISPHGMLDEWSLAQGRLKKRLHLALFSGTMLNHARSVHFEVEEEARQGRVHVRAPVVVGPPPPIDPRAFAALPGPGLAQSTFPALNRPGLKVLFLGRIAPKKAPDALVRAAAIWKREGAQVTTLIAGKGHPPEFEDHCKQLARELSIEDRCHFLGLVTGEQKWSLMQAADVMVLPTSQENFGIALVESMLCGTPVITTKQVDTWREFERAGNWILEGGASVAEQLAGAVAKLIGSDGAELRERGERARRWALATYHPRALAAWYARMLDATHDGAAAARLDAGSKNGR